MATRRASAKTAPVRSRKAAQAINAAPRIMSDEEKRQLILAHARARKPVDASHRMSLWAGVFVCVVFVVGAWLYTVGSGIQRTFAGPMDPNMQKSLELSSQAMSGSVNEVATAKNDFQTRLDELTGKLESLSAEDSVLSGIVSEIASSTTATTSTSPQLFKPTPTSTTSDSQNH
jgi:hypothetical protein